MSSTVCVSCKTALLATDKFCTTCGTRTGGASPSSPAKQRSDDERKLPTVVLDRKPTIMPSQSRPSVMLERQTSTVTNKVLSQQMLEQQKKEADAARKRVNEKLAEDTQDNINRKTLEIETLNKESSSKSAETANLLEMIEALKKEREQMAKQLDEFKAAALVVSASVSAPPTTTTTSTTTATAAAAPIISASVVAAVHTPVEKKVVVEDDRIDPLSIKEGWLNKEGVTRRAMKRRYFILNLNRLQYYDDKSVSAPMLGFVPLYKDTVVQKESGKKGSYVFAITPAVGQRTFFIQAADETTRTAWMTAVKELLPALTLSKEDKRTERLKKKQLVVGKKTSTNPRDLDDGKEQANQLDPLSIKEGYLLKEGEWNHAFKRRYFMLSLNRLQYFKDKIVGEKAQGFIPLYQDTLVVPGNPEKGAHMLWITPAPGDRTFHIQARDDGVRDDWIHAIRGTLKHLLPSSKAKHQHHFKKTPKSPTSSQHAEPFPSSASSPTSTSSSGAHATTSATTTTTTASTSSSSTTPTSSSTSTAATTTPTTTTVMSSSTGSDDSSHVSNSLSMVISTSTSVGGSAGSGSEQYEDLTIEVLEDEDVYVRCVFDFETDVDGDLRFRKGDILRLLTPNVNFLELDPNNPIWLHGELMTTTVSGLDSPLIGTFPSNYVEEIRDKDD